MPLQTAQRSSRQWPHRSMPTDCWTSSISRNWTNHSIRLLPVKNLAPFECGSFISLFYQLAVFLLEDICCRSSISAINSSMWGTYWFQTNLWTGSLGLDSVRFGKIDDLFSRLKKHPSFVCFFKRGFDGIWIQEEYFHALRALSHVCLFNFGF